MERGQRRGGGAGDQRGGARRPADSARTGASRPALGRSSCRARPLPGLVDHHERQHGRERELERGAEHALGPQHQDDQRRPGEQPQRERVAVDDHRQQRHRGHQERALGRHAGARQHAGRTRRPAIATTAASFLTGKRSASGGHRASSQRQAANTLPATSTMCRPDTERMWARPEICMARQVAWSMPARTPGDQGRGHGPGGPGADSVIRLAIAARSSAIASAKLSAAPGRRSAGPIAKPDRAQLLEPGLPREIERRRAAPAATAAAAGRATGPGRRASGLGGARRRLTRIRGRRRLGRHAGEARAGPAARRSPPRAAARDRPPDPRRRRRRRAVEHRVPQPRAAAAWARAKPSAAAASAEQQRLAAPAI